MPKLLIRVSNNGLVSKTQTVTIISVAGEKLKPEKPCMRELYIT
jgi:hypothetical protein